MAPDPKENGGAGQMDHDGLPQSTKPSVGKGKDKEPKKKKDDKKDEDLVSYSCVQHYLLHAIVLVQLLAHCLSSPAGSPKKTLLSSNSLSCTSKECRIRTLASRSSPSKA